MDKNYSRDQEQSSSTPKQQVIEKLKDANNVLVTVKSNPSVDELAATVGLTLMLNKLEKHTTAVFSGEIPSTLEFLKPEDTIETNTDSLRDFIVSLDKSKADKLRYKVEENVVKIFITPYRTSISEADLEFTQGDFNVDAVVALGVTKRDELDGAITAHGRILHDATFITVTTGADFSDLGQINWQDQGASSLSEMLVSISEAFQAGVIDTQIATAFLTGIVSETARFSNPKTTPKVMTMSAQLMAAGANQQLIANELEKASSISIDHSKADELGDLGSEVVESNEDSMISSDGTLSISHDKNEPKPSERKEDEVKLEVPESDTQIDTSDNKLLSPLERAQVTGENSSPVLKTLTQGDGQEGTQGSPGMESSVLPASQSANLNPSSPVVGGGVLPPLEEDSYGGGDGDGAISIDKEGNMTRKAASQPKHKVVQPLSTDLDNELPSPVTSGSVSTDTSQGSIADIEKSLGVKTGAPPQPQAESPVSNEAGSGYQPIDPTSIPIEDNTTLSEIEQAVGSHHAQPQIELDSARDAVSSALSEDQSASLPRADLNAMPLSAPPESVPYDNYRLPDASVPNREVNDVSGNLPDSLAATSANQVSEAGIAPPPVPPPMVPPSQAL